MNFLAHLFLTKDDPELTLGNYIADFIKNKDLVLFPEKVVKAIMLHRHIDQYTDNHAAVLKATKVLRASQGKYAPVVLDIFYDYVLSNSWSKYSDVEITEFHSSMYTILRAQKNILPDHLAIMTDTMIDGNFLSKYSTLDGMRFTFSKIKQRAKFPTNFDSAVDDLIASKEIIENSFHEFFPDIIHQVNEYRGFEEI